MLQTQRQTSHPTIYKANSAAATARRPPTAETATVEAAPVWLGAAGLVPLVDDGEGAVGVLTVVPLVGAAGAPVLAPVAKVVGAATVLVMVLVVAAPLPALQVWVD